MENISNLLISAARFLGKALKCNVMNGWPPSKAIKDAVIEPLVCTIARSKCHIRFVRQDYSEGHVILSLRSHRLCKNKYIHKYNKKGVL